MVTPGTPPVPHVGGPVLPPGEPTVLIGFMPAARVTDMCTCVGPPDAIAKGSASVTIGGLLAARMGDPTVHGGLITVGLPTVLIGDAGQGVQSAATRTPTAAEVQEIQDALDAGDEQKAIDLAIVYYGIDTRNVPNGVQFDPTNPNYGVADFQGNVTIGPAGAASPEALASTIVHETTHANQAAVRRALDPTMTDWPPEGASVDMDEAMAYDSELRSAGNTGLDRNAAEHQIASDRRDEHRNNLPPDDQTRFDNGGYP